RCFRRNVADAEAARAAREATVGQQGNRFAEAGADQRAGHTQHLAHAGAAAWSFVADDDDIARDDPALSDGVHRLFLTLENAGRTAMTVAVGSGDLDDAALGRQIALEDVQTALRLERFGNGRDDLLTGRLNRVGAGF